MPGRSAVLLAVLKKLTNKSLVKGFSSRVLSLEPLAQVRDQPQFLLGGEGCIPLLRESRGKPMNMGGQRASVPQVRGQGIRTSSNGHRGLLLQGVVESVRRRQP